MRIRTAGLTDIGRKRELNEDSFLCAEIPCPSGPSVLMAVADGIGGHAAGEVASAEAVETLRRAVAESLAAACPAPSPAAVLGQAFLRVNEAVHRKAGETEHLNGMGTTLVAALVSGGRAAAANVGDSRLYHIRGDGLTQVTLDHSWAAEQVRHKLMNEDDAARSPFRNMVTRSIGYAAEMIVDTFDLDLAPGDGLLLASDGLYGVLRDKDILKAFRREADPEETCRRLIREADKAGSRDNITAVAARVDAD